VEKALLAIKAAATPDSVSQDFVKTILKIPGGSGNQMASYLKKIGFVKADSSPSEIYTRFRNSASSGAAAAEALKNGYAPLSARNECWYMLPDDKLRGLIIEETGLSEDSPVVTMTLNCMKGLKRFATFEKSLEIITPPIDPPAQKHPPVPPAQQAQSLGLNLGYTINLNLPATADIAVFNAIFRSLKENLLDVPNANG
jgi:hypothetical protein